MKPSEFERWILDDQDLPTGQEQALSNALAVSPRLRELRAGWQAAQAELQQAEPAIPAPGFTERWQARLASYESRRRQRQVNMVLSGTLAGAFGSLAVLAISMLRSPAGLASAVIEAAISIQRQISSGVQLAGALIDGVPLAAGVLLLSVTLAWLSVIWFATLYRYAFQSLSNGERK